MIVVAPLRATIAMSATSVTRAVQTEIAIGSTGAIAAATEVVKVVAMVAAREIAAIVVMLVAMLAVTVVATRRCGESMSADSPGTCETTK